MTKITRKIDSEDAIDIYNNGTSDLFTTGYDDSATSYKISGSALDTGDALIYSTDGALTLNSTGTTQALTLSSTGIFDVDAIGNVTIDSSTGSITMGADLADGQNLTLGKSGAIEMIFSPSATASSETISLTNTSGTAESAIALTSTAGGVNIDAALAKDVNITGGQVALVSKDDSASAISLTTNIGSSETIVLTNTKGTGNSAIALTSTLGGITLATGTIFDVNATGDVTIDSSGGTIGLGTSTSGVAVNIGHSTSEVTIGENLNVTGNLTVSGTTTTINSTTVTIQDPVFEIGDDSSDDTLDRGIKFKYHNGSSAKFGFFGFDDSTGHLTYIPEATGDSNVFDGDLGSLNVAGVTNTTNTLTLTGSTVAVEGASTFSSTITSVGNILPSANDGASLGTSSNGFSDLFLADGSDINLGNDQDVKLSHVENTGIIIDSTTTATDGTIEVLKIKHQTSGAPAAGIGSDIVFSVETAADNHEDGMKLSTVTTDVTGDAENFDFIVSLMSSGFAAAQKLKVDNAGDLTVGTVDADSTIKSNGDSDLILQTGNTTTGSIRIADGNNADITLVSQGTGSTVISNDTDSTSSTTGSLIVSGGLGVAKKLFVGTETSCPLFVTQSDISLKENIVNLDSSLEKVLSLRGVNFDWIDKEKYGNKKQIGFIAQEVEKVVPELVHQQNDIKAVNYSQTVALLVEAMKEQNDVINLLKQEIDNLKK